MQPHKTHDGPWELEQFKSKQASKPEFVNRKYHLSNATI